MNWIDLAWFLAPIFTAIGGAFAAMGTLGKVLLGILINVGMSFLQRLLMPSQPKPDDMQTVFRQSTPIRVVHLGLTRAGGPLLIAETKKKKFYSVTYFSEGPVDAYEEFFVDGRPVIRNAEGWVTSEPYDFRKVILIETRIGKVPSDPYYKLHEKFPGFITRAFRGDGLATALMIADSVGTKKVAKVYPNRLPTLNVIARFGQPYDPRINANRYTPNLVIHTLHYLTSVNGAGIPIERIDLSDFRKAANVADEVLTTKAGGTTQRYHGSTTWKLDETPADVLRRQLLHYDGRIYLKPNGKIGIKVGAWESPTVHIPDEHIVDANIKTMPSPVQEATEVVIKYSNPATSYLQVTSQPWRDDAVVARAGGRVRNLTSELFGIHSHNHARRVAKILSAKANPRYHGTIVTTLYGMMAWDQRFITISFAGLGIVNQPIEIADIAFDEETLTVEIQFISVSADMYAFNPATEEGTAPVDPNEIDPEAVDRPDNFNVRATTKMLGGKKVAVLEMSVEIPAEEEERDDEDDEDDKIEVEFQYAVADSFRWRAIGGPSENTEAEVTVEDGKVYDARARLRAGDGSAGPWVVVENINAIADTVAPSAPTGVSLSAAGPNTARLGWTTPNSANFAKVFIYRSSSNDSAGATHVDTVYGGPRSAVTYDHDTEAAGTFFFWISAANDSSVESARVALGSVRIP